MLDIETELLKHVACALEVASCSLGSSALAPPALFLVVTRTRLLGGAESWTGGLGPGRSLGRAGVEVKLQEAVLVFPAAQRCSQKEFT